MEQYNRYEFEGEVIEVPVYWDDHLQREVEDYEDYYKQPGHTPSGRPVLLTFEDACPYADMVDDDPASVDCGSCRHYHQFPGSLLGVCRNEKCAPAADNSTGANTVNMMAHCAAKGEFDMSENKKLNEQIAQDFYNNFQGKLEDEKLDQVVQEIKCTENKYHTQGSLINWVVYFRVTVGAYFDVKKQFTGNGGGIGFPGTQALIGDLYTNDLERLYRDTDSFEVNVTPVYTSVLFFDKSSRLLGHFQAGAISTPTSGIGGGTGSWK